MKIKLLVLITLLFQGGASASFFKLTDNPELSDYFQLETENLCQIAKETHNYIKKNKADSYAVHPGYVFNNISLDDVSNTLDFICQTYQEDIEKQQASRLKNRSFLKQYFDFYQWQPDIARANVLADKSRNKIKSKLLRSIPKDKILLTKYYTKLLEGSETKTAKFNQALYSLPYDENGLSEKKAQALSHQLTRFKYTRQEIINGALLKNKWAKPLIWLTEEALHDVLLQGTGVLNVNGEVRYFNVHRNNGIDYDYAIGKREQARYWYFAEVPSIMGYGSDIENKIALRPHVSFAGNVAKLGLGKLILVNYNQTKEGEILNVNRMGILADQGGAFDNNLFQLDFLVDSYRGWSDYYHHNKHLPDYAKAWIMVLKNK